MNRTSKVPYRSEIPYIAECSSPTNALRTCSLKLSNLVGGPDLQGIGNYETNTDYESGIRTARPLPTGWLAGISEHRICPVESVLH
jgi:hypothetical protein